MGTFSDWAQNYYDLGLSVLPVSKETKACYVKEWTKVFCKNIPSEQNQEFYINKYKDEDIGLALGPASGLIAIDFDYSMPDAEIIEEMILAFLPPSPVEKRGKVNGWTKFYKFNSDIGIKHIQRFGKAMVDVLSDGSMTVLPPSMHKSGKPYFWSSTDTLLDIDINNLPELNNSHIKRLYEISEVDNSFFNELLEEKKGRHNLVVGFVLYQANIANDLNELIKLTLDYDINVLSKHDKGRYFTDKHYFKDELGGVTSLVTRLCGWKKKKLEATGVAWDIGKPQRLKSGGKKQSIDYNEFKNFFEFKYKNVRKDIVSSKTFTKNKYNEKWESIRNHIKIIQSEVTDINLSKSYVEPHLERWIEPITPRLLIDIPKWDGTDYIKQMMDSLIVNNISQNHACELMKQWCANVFSRIDDPLKNQNPMLIFKGSQGIGKDRFISHMFAGLKNYFSEIDINENKAETLTVVEDLLVAYIPEFDETHKVSISTLKSLISGSKNKLRRKYDRDASDIDSKVSYISSMNFNKILRDTSGNRRFWIFDIDKIEWIYDKIPTGQLLAQQYHLYKNAYNCSSESISAMESWIKSKTPEDARVLIEEEIKHIIYMNSAKEVKLRWPKISKQISDIAHRYGWKLQNIQTFIGELKFRDYDDYGPYYFLPEKVAVDAVKNSSVLDFYCKKD